MVKHKVFSVGLYLLGLNCLFVIVTSQCTPPSVSNAVYTPNNASFTENETITYVCDTGYGVTSGDTVLTCLSNDSWLGSTPNCSIIQCPAISVPSSSYLPNLSSHNYNTSVTYSCDSGYNHTSGDLIRTCLENGTWSGSLPVCSIIQCPAINVPSSSYLPNLSSHNYNTSVTYSCDTGYNHTSGDLIRTCLENGTWSGSLPACSIVQCAAINVSSSSYLPNLSSHDYNTSVTYLCDTGYNHTGGDLIRTCLENGTWSGSLTACSIIQCPAISVPSSSYLPNLSSHNYNTSVTYSCDTGYNHTSGYLIRTCLETGTWSGALPVCSIVQCAATSVPSSSYLPNLSSHNYNTSVTYSCDSGYNHTSGDLIRTCLENGTWSGSLPTCSIIQCAATSVPNSAYLPNLSSHNYNTSVTYSCDTGYNHTSGDLIRTCLENGTWSGSLPVCSIVQCSEIIISSASYLPNLSSHNYNTSVTYSCDTGYNHTSGDLIRTCLENGTWSGSSPACSIVQCAATSVPSSSYLPNLSSHNYNTSVTYSCDTGYNHTSGDLIRTCFENGTWSGSLPACSIVQCAAISAPSSSYLPNLSSHDYNTSVTYLCDTGYNHTGGDLIRTCLENGTWSGSLTACSIIQCPAISVPSSSYLPNLSSHNYNTSVTYSCDTGYNHTSGYLIRTCLETGTWSGALPVCSIVQCAATSVPSSSYLPNLSSHNYNTSVTYSCDSGYNHTSGDLIRTCLENGTWSGSLPTCSIIQCAATSVPNSAYLPNLSSHNYNTSVTYSCDTGYNHTSGDLIRTCLENGTWSGSLPVCSIVQCSEIIISSASYLPNLSSHNYNTSVTYSCDTGYNHTGGDLIRTCLENGTWSGSSPACSIVQCAATSVPSSSYLPNLSSHNYNTSVTYSCDTGYIHTSGDLIRTCFENGTWSGSLPACSIVQCAAISAPSSSYLPNLSSHDYNTSVTYLCDTGYNHTGGYLIRTCLETGTWSGSSPACSIITCVASDVINSSKLPDQASYDYNTSLVYACDAGFYHASGNLTQTCLPSGVWSGALPSCQIVACAKAVETFTSQTPDQALHDYNNSVTYTCEIGYNLASGDLIRTCLASGNWSGTAPLCSIVTCAKMVEPFTSQTPDQALHDYNNSVTYSCDTGYNLASGDLIRTCLASGNWSGTAPLCSIVQCSVPAAVAYASVTPNSTVYNYSSAITYTCDTGYYMSAGNATRTCTENGTWDNTTPICSRIKCAEEVIANATKSPDVVTYDYYDNVTFTCVYGYYHAAGDLTRSCVASETWSGSTPVCLIVTCTAVDILGSSKSPDQSAHDYNTNVTFSCSVGFIYTSGDLTRTCQADGTFTGIAPICTIKTCNSSDVTFATKSPNNYVHDFNTSVTYTCDLGYYKSSGDASLTCQADETWSGVLPVCSLVTCSELLVNFATKVPDTPSYDYNTSVTYTCITGYNISAGDLTRTCQADFTWDGSVPVCTIVTCNKQIVAFSTVVPDQSSYDYNTNVSHTCNLGYNHTSGDLDRTCNETGLWTGTLPVCTVSACLPAETSLGTISPALITHEFYSNVTYTCDSGYYISAGDTTRMCQTDGTWTGTTPTCSRVTCLAPSAVSFTTHAPVLAVYDFSATISYDCVLAYNHTAGYLLRTCQQDFTWSGSAPVCNVSYCIQENSTYMTPSPNQVLHNFDDVITYTCNLGYNYTAGDVNRTCLTNGSWTGTLPYCTIITCPQSPIPEHTYITPNISESDYNTTITYTCELGYNRTGGDETRRCTETRAWEGQEANCTLVTCGPPDIIGNGTFSPSLSVYNYSDVVTYTCDYGYYHGSGNISRRCNEFAVWTGTKPICPIVQCTKIDELHASVVPDQPVHDFNTTATYTCDLGYNLTAGDSIRTCQANWTYDGIAPNCTIITCPQPPIPDNTYITPNISESDYNTTITYTCELGYNRTGGDETWRCTETQAWEGQEANCTLVTCDAPDIIGNGTFTPSQSVYNYSNTVVYTCDYGYYLASGDLVRNCTEFATWSGMKPTCLIVQCNKSVELHSTMIPDQSYYDFNTSVNYTCNLGYNLTDGNDVRTCQANWTYDGAPPNCTIITCPQPPIPDYTYITPNISESDYNTTITYTCELGYNRTGGDETRRCTETRVWEGQEANCTLVTCDPPVSIGNGTFSPSLSTYNYSDTVTYTCDYGYYHASGDLTTSCSENATWTGTTPICLIVQCNKTIETHSSITPDQLYYDFNTSVTYTCDLGYNLTDGNDVRTCQANWTYDGTPPNCTIITCPQPPIPEHTYITPNISESDYNTTITYTCELGYNRTGGDETRRCTETRAWEGQEANCTLVTCDPPESIGNGTFTPILASYNYTNTVTYSCDYGYYHASGNLTRDCTEHANWTGIVPVCPIVQCNETLEPYSTVSPSQPLHDFNTSVTYTCDLGYNLTDGNSIRTCQANWTFDGSPPNCTIITCPQPPIPDHTYITPNISESDYNTTITYTCELGYNRTGGDETRRCTETRAWEGQEANCTLITCDPPDIHGNGTFSPWLPYYNYSTIVTYSCDIGYYHTSGDFNRSCTENATWTGITPTCSIVQCNETLEPHSTVSPSQPLHDFNTSVTYTCGLGYNLTDGNSIRTCQANWTYDGSPPNCTLITCPHPPIPDNTYITPNISESDYNTTITYTCELGYNRTGGDETRRCTETRAWEGQEANCTLVTCDPPDTILHGTYIPDLTTYNYTNIVTYVCDHGYYYTGGNITKTCTEHANWTGINPICSIVQCNETIEPHSTVSPSQPLHDFNTSVTYTCDLGYNLTDGNSIRTCQANWTYDGSPPNCTLITCPQPPIPDHTYITPNISESDYNTTITYTCELGYNRTGGDETRRCTETRAWEGQDANCTLVECDPPDAIQNGTFTPVLAVYNYSNQVDYSCNYGYYHNGGDLARVCTEFGTWNGTPALCPIVQCSRLDEPYSTILPYQAMYDFNTSISYTCILGYNLTGGDAVRTCQANGNFTGTPPNCTIITCDPPTPIAHTVYAPVLVEHEWNTTLDYSCEVDYHYVSGIMSTTCNESGLLSPVVDLNCSVFHTLTIDPSEPSVQWLNSTVTSTDILFPFDGLCDVTITCTPNKLDVTYTINGTIITVTVSEKGSTSYGDYVVDLQPFRNGRVWTNVSTNVFYGEEVLNLAARLVVGGVYIAVGESYNYEATLTQGTTVTMDWVMMTNATISNFQQDVLTIDTISYTYPAPGTYNISVTGTNSVSQLTVYVPVIVIYRPNNIAFNVSSNTGNTTHNLTFTFEVDNIANLPMDVVNFTIDYNHGVGDSSTHTLNESVPNGTFYSYPHLFDIQGIYTVNAWAVNILDHLNFSVVVNIWDPLDTLNLGFLNASGIYKTNESAFFIFTDPPNSGFEYTIDYGDGVSVGSADSSILYHQYNLSHFDHVFTVPGVYTVTWTAQNGGYSNNGQLAIIVQNPLPTTGYTLKPNGEKYPWLNLQTMNISNNLTLDASVALPTNASCTFDPANGGASDYNISFANYFFEHLYTYLVEGTFYPSFNCSNLVSMESYQFNLTVEKFKASYINFTFSSPQPFNKSDSLELPFYITHGDFALMPMNVSLTWSFDDGSTNLTYTYDTAIYNHTFQDRGNFTVSLLTEVPVSNTSNVISQPLRLGIMYFLYGENVSFVSVVPKQYAMYGVDGINVTYTLSFTDGSPSETCLSTNNAWCIVDHICPDQGYFLVTAICSNGSFVEFDSVNVTCDNPFNLTLDVPPVVPIPDGMVELLLHIQTTDYFLPKLSCEISMGDPILRDSHFEEQQVTHTDSFNLTFQYMALGRHTVNIHCWNLVNDTVMVTEIIVVNANFKIEGVFDRFYSQTDSPLLISAMLDTEIFERLEINASYAEKTHINDWQPQNTSVDLGEGANRHSLEITRGMLADNLYRIDLRISFEEEPNNTLSELTYIRIVSPPPHAEVVGGARREVQESENVTIDAYSLSYDPAYPYSNLSFSIDCEGYDANDFDDALDKHTNNNPSSICDLTNTGTGLWNLDTTSFPSNIYFCVVTVTADNSRGNMSTYTQVLREQSAMNEINIRCEINCLSKVAVTSSLKLVADFNSTCIANFTWHLQQRNGTYGSYLDTSSMRETDSTGRTFILNENVLTAGYQYLVTLIVSDTGIVYGPAYYEFYVNSPPRNGSCEIKAYDYYIGFLMDTGQRLPVETFGTGYVYNSSATLNVYNITCLDWQDEGFTVDTWTTDHPLYYYFFVKHNGVEKERQIVYFDPGQTSNLVSFRVGDPSNSYRATVVLRIQDVLGDYTELSYSVNSIPPLTSADMIGYTTAEQLTNVSSYITQFDDQMIKANRSWDHRTLARKIIDIASVYNALLLNNTIAITLGPADLLNLGYQRHPDTGEYLVWSDYMTIIVDDYDTTVADYISNTGERYAAYILESVETWPVTKRIPIPAIESMSRALNISMSVDDYTNVTAAVHSSKCVDAFAASLASYSDDRTFPNTAHMYSAMIGTFDLIGNLLAELHAVLTPNLPEDPTIDEMRNFLEYMRDFKTTDEIIQEPLSLQEQAFLAQKQLQKYYVEKYIKSQAGILAMPKVTNALQNFTYILGKLSNVGQGEKIFQNDYLYVSTEIQLASNLENSTISRPQAAMSLGSLSNVVTTNCQATEVLLRSFVFAYNPYFWGTNGDRVSSVVPVFEIAGATLNDSSLKFTLDNAEMPLCQYQTPAYDKSDPNKMVYVLFDRMYVQDDIIVYVRQNTTELVYQLYFNPSVKPSVVEKRYAYTVEITSSLWTDEDGHKLIIPASNFGYTGKIWIGIRPILQRSTDVTLLTLPICANVSSVSCLAYTTDATGNDFWDSNMCQVSRDSTRAQTVCECTNTWPSSKMTVGSTHYVTPNIMNFEGVVQGVYPIGRDPVLGLIIATLCLYCLLVAWAWREDELDKYKFAYSLLIDNDIADSYFYIMRVYTGLRSGSGTKSKIGFVIVGESNKTIVRVLDDEAHVGFGRGSVRTFVMSNRRPLGELISLRIWHNDTGDTESAWFLNKISITDLQTGSRCVFMSDQWFDYDQGDHKVERVLTAKPFEKSHSLKDLYSYIMAEHHLWISILIRPLRSNFTRIQRLSCLMGMIYMTMIVTITIVKTPDEVTGMEQVIIGPFRFSRENFESSMVAVSIATFFVMIASFFFRNCDSPTGSVNIKSLWRRMYIKINSILKIDKTVLGTTFLPPAEDAVQYGVHWLPDACLYIGWTILGISVMITTYWLVVVSEKWRQIKSEEWLTTVLCGFVASFLIIETAKCLIVFFYYLVSGKLIYEPPDPQIDVESLKEITRHNSASLRISPDFDTTLEKPQSPDEETLKNNRKKRIGNHQLLRMFYQLALFSGILYIVYTISYESRDPNSYYLKSDIESMFGFKESVTDMASFTTWLSGRFLDTYFAHSYFGASYDSAFKMYINDLVNVRVGPARLRQLRVTPESCDGPLADYIGTCYGNYDAKNTESFDYCLGWKSQPCPVSEKSSYFSSAAWLYTSPNDVWGFTTTAEYGSYSAGGYFMKLDVNKDISQIIFSELVQYSWYDRQTRAAILEFTVYNANSNLFAYCKFLAEMTEVGGILPYVDIQVFRLYLNAGPDGNFILFLEFAFFLLVIAGTVYILYDLCTDPKAFVKSVWNWLDVIALIMAYITVSIFIFKIFIIQRTIEVFNTDKNAYVGFENLAFYDFVVNTSHGVLVFLLSIRVSRILGYSGKINEMAAVIANSAKDLGGFFIVFSITYLSFVCLGTHLFGKNVSKYRSLIETYGTLTEGVIGKNRISDILDSNPGYAEFYYFLYVLFVLLTLKTLAAAILNFSISDVRKESKDLKATSIVEVVIETLRTILGRIGTSLGKKPKPKTNNDRRDSEELKDILNDFRFFIRGVMATEKPSDRYKLVTPDIPDDADSGMGYQ